MSLTPEFMEGLRGAARALKVPALDLATVISYETAGTFDPAKSGPTTQHGRHRGLIQFGEPQARQYGVDWNDPVRSQLGESGAIVKYLTDRGFKPGGSLLDLYSTINAGAPGKYSASDASNGGAPGSVRDKVFGQMADHRRKAAKYLGVQVADSGDIMSDAGFTVEQRRALALARARRRRSEAQAGNPPPAGMTAQQAAEADMAGATQGVPERRAYEASPIASGVASAIKGVPFVGEYADEATGAVFGDQAMERQRMAAKGFETANPLLATGLQLGTGVAATVPMAMAAAPAVMARAGSSLASNVVRGAAAGIVAGGTEGAVSGYGAGNDGDRVDSAVTRGAIGAGLGGVIGAATPFISKGISNAASYFRGRPDAAASRALGGSPESVSVVGRMLTNDDPARAVSRIDRAGPGAMIADAGPTTGRLLDTAMQSPTPAAGIAKNAVEARAADATSDIHQALDNVMGRPVGVRKAAKEIAQRTSAARTAAYDRAYAAPIDYASQAGRDIEDVVSRIPSRIKSAAIADANEEMVSLGLKNQQIMASIAPDGSVTFTKPLNVRQLDALKQSLDKLGSETDLLGRPTKDALRPRRLAKELRKALGDAVPLYNRATQLGGQKIAEDQALDIGRRILSDKTFVEDVEEVLSSATAAQMRAARTGLRQQIDKVMATARRPINDVASATDAAEGVKALRALSSRDVQDKLRLVLGDVQAETLIGKMEQASQAFALRVRTAVNSATFPREVMNEAIRDLTEPYAIQEMFSSPVGAARKVMQAMTNMTPTARKAVEDRIMGEVATILTGPRGKDAQVAAAELVRLMQRQPATEALAKKIGTAAGVATVSGGYQAGVQPARSQR